MELNLSDLLCFPSSSYKLITPNLHKRNKINTPTQPHIHKWEPAQKEKKIKFCLRQLVFIHVSLLASFIHVCFILSGKLGVDILMKV